MATAKLRIDLSQGLVEAEGSDDFVLAVYNDFKDRISTASEHRIPSHAAAPNTTDLIIPAVLTPKDVTNAKGTSQGNGNSKGKKKTRETPTFVKDLDLLKGGKLGRLKDFYAKYETKSNLERNLIFVYYLQHGSELDGITCNHIFSCYREVSAKIPVALRQSIADTAHQKNWLDTADMSAIKTATTGVNHLEHDLQKKAVD